MIGRLPARATAAHDQARPWRVFDRPVLLLAAPRSGSTLLQDLLAPHPDLVSWPFEATSAFEAVAPATHDVALGHRWPPSYADEQLRKDLSRELYLGRRSARRRNGLSVGRTERLALRKVRLLEKTPSNILRVGVLARLFPDARLVHLHRDAPSSIASLLESWETPSAAHARIEVGDRTVDWMMLAPPGWLDRTDESHVEKAAFQWEAAARYALEDLDELPPDRVLHVAYESLLADPGAVLRHVLDHCQLRHDPAVLVGTQRIGERGRTSLSAPRADKWRAREDVILPVLPRLADLRRRLGYAV